MDFKLNFSVVKIYFFPETFLNCSGVNCPELIVIWEEICEFSW